MWATRKVIPPESASCWDNRTQGGNIMSMHLDPLESRTNKFPWHLLWVLGAFTLAAINISEFRVTGKPSSAVLASAWICWAFSWYAKPFHVNFRAKASNALIVEPLRSWVPQKLWIFVTFGAFALMLAGLVLRFTNAA